MKEQHLFEIFKKTKLNNVKIFKTFYQFNVSFLNKKVVIKKKTPLSIHVK